MCPTQRKVVSLGVGPVSMKTAFSMVKLRWDRLQFFVIYLVDLRRSEYQS